MRLGKVVLITVLNAFLSGLFLAQYLGVPGHSGYAPTTWLVLAIALAALSLWRVRMIWRAERRASR